MTVEDILRKQARINGTEDILDEAVESANVCLNEGVSKQNYAGYITAYYQDRVRKQGEEIQRYIDGDGKDGK